jgi:hypothetical protein
MQPTGFLLGLVFNPEDASRGNTFLWNVGWLSTEDAALYPTRQNSSQPLLHVRKYVWGIIIPGMLFADSSDFSIGIILPAGHWPWSPLRLWQKWVHSSPSIIRSWYNRPISGRRTKWTQSHPTPRNLNLTVCCHLTPRSIKHQALLRLRLCAKYWGTFTWNAFGLLRGYFSLFHYNKSAYSNDCIISHFIPEDLSPPAFLMKLVKFNYIYRRVTGDDRTECFSTGIRENITEGTLTKRASTALNNRVAFRTQPNNGQVQRNPAVYAYILQINKMSR